MLTLARRTLDALMAGETHWAGRRDDDAYLDCHLGGSVTSPVALIFEGAFAGAHLRIGPLLSGGWEARFRDTAGMWQQPMPVTVVELENDLFAKAQGIFESRVLADKSALVIGVGSGGSFIALELAKAGIGGLTLVDPDRLEVGNIGRHVCGLTDVGRYKTLAVRDQLHGRNPYVRIATRERAFDWDTMGELRALMESVDLVLCCTDNRPSRLVTNLAALAANRPCIYGGTFVRAHGGIVNRVVRDQTPCYQCFVDALPETAWSQEITNEEQASRISYFDRPTAIEPGLSLDVLSIALHCTKLAMLELVSGSSALRSLREDLRAPAYQWLNRREEDYAALPPLPEATEMRILSWYPLLYERNPHCAACGETGHEGRSVRGFAMAAAAGAGTVAAWPESPWDGKR